MKVFLSYADTDKKALVKDIITGLEQAGFDVWDAEREIFPGDNWAEKIAQGLKESEAVVLLITPDSVHSKEVDWITHYVLGNKYFKDRLIPVLIGPPEKIPESSIPWIFRHLKMVNLPERGKQEESIRQIAQALKAVA